MELLLGHKADVNVKSSTGDTALDLAVKGKREDVAELLRTVGTGGTGTGEGNPAAGSMGAALLSAALAGEEAK